MSIITIKNYTRTFLILPVEYRRTKQRIVSLQYFTDVFIGGAQITAKIIFWIEVKKNPGVKSTIFHELEETPFIF